MIYLRFTTETKKHIYHNPDSKDTIVLECSYFGVYKGDFFTGIKSTKGLDNKEFNGKTHPVPSGYLILSQFCKILPLFSFVSLIAGIIFFVDYFSKNMIYAIGALLLGFLMFFLTYILL